MNTRVQISPQDPAFFLSFSLHPPPHHVSLFLSSPKMRWLAQMVILLSIFGGISTQFFMVVVPIYFSTNSGGSLFSTSSLPFVISCHFNDSHSNRGTFPDVSDGKESACNAGDLGLIFGLGRPPGEGNGYPLQCSFLENSRTEESGMLQSLGLQRVRHN